MTNFDTFTDLINKSKYWQIDGIYDELDNKLSKINWQQDSDISLKLSQKNSTINNGIIITFTNPNQKARLAFDNGTPDEQGMPYSLNKPEDWRAFKELITILNCISQDN